MVYTKSKPDLFFSIGFGLIALVAIMDIVAALSFAVHIPLAEWHFPLSILLMVVASYLYINNLNLTDKRAFVLKTILALLVVTVLSVIIATNFYDLSFDGQEYHQEGVYQLGHNHWNPFYTVLPNTVNQAIWVNHYAKQSETSGAVVYALTHHIESGKSLNFILLIASFCLTFSFLRQYTTFKNKKIWLLSFLFACNPIAISQVFTYLVDGQLASMLLCLLIISFVLYHETSTYKLLLFAFIIIICLNIKFTAVVFAGIFIVFLLILLILNKQIEQFWRVFIAAAAGTFLGIALVGFNPYVVNTINNGNPFYPLLGKNKVDIMTFTSPAGFPQKNRFDKFFISMFSHSDNIDVQVKDRVPELKIPFTLNKIDIISLTNPYIRIAGFGPFFSGVFLITLFLLGWLIITQRKVFFKNYLAGYLLMLTISIFILEEAWWARYVPQLWFIPLITLIMIEAFDIKWVKYLKNFTYIILIANLGLFGIVILETNLLKTAEINYQLSQFKATGKPISVNFNKFEANRIRFDEHQIPYIRNTFTDSSLLETVYSRTTVKLSKPLPDVEMPWLVKIANRLKGKK